LATPLYKRLKTNGTSFYAFPGAAEDISAAYQNKNYSMYFSKYVLLNFPKQVTDSGTNSNPLYFDFTNLSGEGRGFQSSISYTQPTNFQDQLVESLRNYVANHEEVMKDSKVNNNEYYYDNTDLSTPTEKIFWKWCRKLGLISLEAANDGDEFFGNNLEFESNDPNDPEYLPEILWKERDSVEYDILTYIKSGNNRLQLEFDGLTRFQVGDTIEFFGIEDSNITPYINNGDRARITAIDTNSSNSGHIITTSKSYNNTNDESYDALDGSITLVYHKLVQYIGEVNGINNVQQANRSYTEVYIHIPDSTGATPDILFRTKYDLNYKPNLQFPILPSQFQPEIKGAEIFSNPLVSNPSNYPGGYFGQFDTEDFTYETSSGDSLRRSGDYFGIGGNINTPVVDASMIDGIVVDFNTDHYVKMNILGKEVTNFDQFNMMQINNQPPQDFEFNAILWYYTVEEFDGTLENNLYGISFVDNPDNNPIDSEIGIRVPAFRKLAANNEQDGVSYAFSLNLNFNIINENPQDTLNPEAINSLFGFNLYNEAMSRLSSVNDSFLKIIMTQNQISSDLVNLKQLLYSQTDFATINKKITNLERLLNLYSVNQIVNSDTISVQLDNSVSPPNIKLNTSEPEYDKIFQVRTSNLYDVNGTIPLTIEVPDMKSFLIYIENDDVNKLTLPNNDKLEILLSADLSFKQSFHIIVDSTIAATENKRLEIYLNYKYGDNNIPIVTQLIETIDLPIYYNSNLFSGNNASKMSSQNLQIDLTKDITLNTGGILELPIDESSKIVYNYFNKGETYILDGFFVGTQSLQNFSGQYLVNNVGLTNSYVYFDVNNNLDLINYGASASLPLIFNKEDNFVLSSKPMLRFNKGVKYKITRILESDYTEISERYLVEKTDLGSSGI